MKDIIVLGGPNGAGKTGAAEILLPERLGIAEFVNADEIAKGLSPFNVEEAAIAAGRVMIERMRALMQREQSFAVETTCAGQTQHRMVSACRNAGWRVTLLFLWLPSPEAAIARVSRRVREGGHFVPDHVVIRRYWAGLRNLRCYYLPVAHIAAVYDNSDAGRVLIAEKSPEHSLQVRDAMRWKSIEDARL